MSLFRTLVIVVTFAREFFFSEGSTKPNVVLILADDMGQWAARTYGNPEIITPNIDKLADEGLKFMNAFSNTPVGSASRASYFTGRSPSQHGVHDWIAGGNGCDDNGISYTQRETAYTDVLAMHNYTCGISGKYHLGNQKEPQHGFKHWFVHQSGGGSYINPPLVKDMQCVSMDGYITDIITDDAIGFIENYNVSVAPGPFYLSVHYTAPQSPYVGQNGMANSMHPPGIVAKYNNSRFISCPQEPRNPYADHRNGLTDQCLGNRECLKGYFAAVTAMDLNIGRILDTLSKHDLDSSTLVIFSSDNGFNAGHHGLWGKGNATYPFNMFETSLKIPMIWRHEGFIQPGIEESIVQVLDVAPTILDYVGGIKFDESVQAGESFKDLLLNPSSRNSRIHRTIFGEYGQTRFGRLNGVVKYITRQTGHVELYDLIKDANETVNLLSPSGGTAQSYVTVAMTYEYAVRQFFSFIEDPYVSGWNMPVTGAGQQQAIYYNQLGWPNAPAFRDP